MLNTELKEIWKPIKNYEGLYEISNFGNVRRLRFINGKHNFEHTKMCKLTLNTYGYITVNLCKNGKANTKRVHRLVAETFLGESKLQVDHIDGNKSNNRIDNLEYVTPKENTNRAWEKGLAKYTDKRKEKVKDKALERWKTNSFRKWRGARTI